MKYRKKPLVVDAIQWTGDLPLPEEFEEMGFLEDENGYDLLILTKEGEMRCKMDDWIIKGIEGEFYCCKNSVFQETYEWTGLSKSTSILMSSGL